MNPLNKEAIFFDLDGTLLDSLEGITNSFIYAFGKINRTMPNEPVQNFIGPPLAHSLAKFFDSEEEVAKVTSIYREYYLDKGLYQCKLYDGIMEMLKELNRRGYRLYVATSKPTPLAKMLLNKFNVTGEFVAIYGAENDTNRGTKDIVLKEALEDSEEPKDKSLMIGDSLWDREGAIVNGIDFGAVLYGFGERHTIDYKDNYFTAEIVMDILQFLP